MEPLNAGATGFYVNPIRQKAASGLSGALQWDTTNSEIVYNTNKTFVIDHPLDPENRYLIHGCLEGPESGVYYRGVDKTEYFNGKIYKKTVHLPSYIKNFTEFTVTATPIFNGNNITNINVSKVINQEFTVYSSDECEFNWTAIGKRENIIVESYKKDLTIKGQGPYKYF
jgi:hypothetical protein